MAAEIKAGTIISIKVKRTVIKEAAAKTLSRLFAKDPVNRQARGRRKKLLKSAFRVRRRGGRPWEIRPKAPRLFQPTVGDSCTVRATSDVLGDLKSLTRYVDVTPKK
ncbi:MAG: hypothetical protein HZA51_06500 [Planctomycetes bacterium]|nr:hypothetical protein [Planctomycetota bacterium]